MLALFSRLPGSEVSTGVVVHTDAAAAAAMVSTIVLFAGMEVHIGSAVRTGIVVFKGGAVPWDRKTKITNSFPHGSLR